MRLIQAYTPVPSILSALIWNTRCTNYISVPATRSVSYYSTIISVSAVMHIQYATLVFTLHFSYAFHRHASVVSNNRNVSSSDHSTNNLRTSNKVHSMAGKSFSKNSRPILKRRGLWFWDETVHLQGSSMQSKNIFHALPDSWRRRHQRSFEKVGIHSTTATASQSRLLTL